MILIYRPYPYRNYSPKLQVVVELDEFKFQGTINKVVVDLIFIETNLILLSTILTFYPEQTWAAP